MDMKDMTISDYSAVLASKEPVPGGGGASAVVGCLSAALGSMVCSLTTGKKKFLEYESFYNDTIKRLEEIRLRFLSLSDEDAKVFLPLSEAYKLPKDDPHRDEIMEPALAAAAEVPLEIMRNCCEVIDIFAELLDKSSALVLSDVGVGVSFAASALMSASLNVFINTKAMKDREKAGQMETEADELCEKYLPVSDDVFSEVMARLR